LSVKQWCLYRGRCRRGNDRTTIKAVNRHLLCPESDCPPPHLSGTFRSLVKRSTSGMMDKSSVENLVYQNHQWKLIFTEDPPHQNKMKPPFDVTRHSGVPSAKLIAKNSAVLGESAPFSHAKLPDQ